MSKSEKRVILTGLLGLAVCIALGAGLLIDQGKPIIEFMESEPSILLTFNSGAWINLPVFVFVLTLLWGVVAVGWEMQQDKICLHRLVLILVLLAGFMGVMCRPAMEFYGWDESTHRGFVYIFSGYEPYTLDEYLINFSTWFFGYMPYTLGVAAGNLLNLSEAAMLRMGSLTGIAVYAVMAALAVKYAPRYKVTFAFFALLPTCIALAGFHSYDATVIGYLLLGLALLLDEMDKPEKLLSGGKSLAMIFLFVIGTIAKPAYSLLLLLLWMLPVSKFSSKKRQTLFRLFVLLMLVMCLVSMTLGTYDNVAGGDERMGDTDSAGQIAFVLSQPATFFQMFGNYLKSNALHLFTSIGACWGLLNSSAKVSQILVWALFLLCPLCSLQESTVQGLSGRRRIWMAVLAWLPLVALMVAQYIVSTPVGHHTIDGMQPRYTLPVMVTWALALMYPKKLRQLVAVANRAMAAGLMLLVWGGVYWSAFERLLVYCYGL